MVPSKGDKSYKMVQVYDFHCHSDQSDGVLSPEHLVARAKDHGVNCLALTDHDTVAGIARARAHAVGKDITLVAGIELSTQWQGRGVHIVGLDIDVFSPVIVMAVERQSQARELRAITIADRLDKAGIHGALEGARTFAGDASLARPHFARFLVESGAVSNMSQAFKRFLGTGKPGDVKSQWPDICTAVGWIRDAGGVAVLAHPAKYKLTRTKLCVLTQLFAEAGGRAIEVVSGKQPVGLAENLAKIAHQFQLAGSCGSDFHVPDQPWQELGCGSRLPAGVPPVWELLSSLKKAKT